MTRAEQTQVKDDDIKVVADVALVPNSKGGFVLTVALDVAITSMDQATAEAIVAGAHEVCPSSNAVKGNIDTAFKAP